MLGPSLKVVQDKGWVAPTTKEEVMMKAKARARKLQGIFKGTEVSVSRADRAGREEGGG